MNTCIHDTTDRTSFASVHVRATNTHIAVGNGATGKFRDPENEDPPDRRRHMSDSIERNENVFDRPGEPWPICPTVLNPEIFLRVLNMVLPYSRVTVNTS